MGSRKTEFAKCFVVRHPEHGPAYVVADNWEQATVKAAQFWGVPWAKVAFDCTMEKTMEARKGVCIKCRRIIYSSRELCEDCDHELQTRNTIAQKKMRDTWYLGRKDGAFGT